MDGLSQKNDLHIFTFLLILTHSFPSSRATQIEILNQCSYTVWVAATPGGGKQLNQDETWTLTNLTSSGRIWGRTNCNFNDSGSGKCESGDCGGRLECKTKGRAPNTVAEYALKLSGYDSLNVSVVEGFNIPMEFRPASESSEGSCRGESKCRADANKACPMELRDPGGCNNPCTVFSNSQFCCTSGLICEPTTYSKFFKDLCPFASTYPSEGQRSVCPTGTDYKLVFCPSNDDSVSNAAFFEIQNNCSYTVWAAAYPGGGRRLDPKQKWLMSINKAAVSSRGRIWGRTNCTFDDSGRGKCETGDCGGVLECKNSGGQPPSTLAEYALNQLTDNLDFFDVSLVDGFNIPMDFGLVRSESRCKERISCTGDINGDCPNELRAPGGCNNACSVYKTDQYCCGGVNSTACGPTVFSLFFKDRCPDAYSYPLDDKTATFVCPGGNSYQVVFCP